jgi:hypothetical protein
MPPPDRAADAQIHLDIPHQLRQPIAPVAPGHRVHSVPPPILLRADQLTLTFLIR